MSAKAGRLLDRNPFAGLRIARTKGRAGQAAPTVEQLKALVLHARELTPPSFAAYLEFAAVSAARPGELDALRWERVRWEDDEVDLVEQWNAKTRTFTSPKYGAYTIALVGRAREVLLRMRQDTTESPFVFTTVRGTHYTPSSRTHHWNRVRAAAGLADMPLYLATRHHFGWHALNILGLPPHVIAERLGHKVAGSGSCSSTATPTRGSLASGSERRTTAPRASIPFVSCERTPRDAAHVAAHDAWCARSLRASHPVSPTDRELRADGALGVSDRVRRGAIVATVKPPRSGGFRARSDIPASQSTVFLRAQTEVRRTARSRKLSSTFTLIGGVRLGG